MAPGGGDEFNPEQSPSSTPSLPGSPRSIRCVAPGEHPGTPPRPRTWWRTSRNRFEEEQRLHRPPCREDIRRLPLPPTPANRQPNGYPERLAIHRERGVSSPRGSPTAPGTSSSSLEPVGHRGARRPHAVCRPGTTGEPEELPRGPRGGRTGRCPGAGGGRVHVPASPPHLIGYADVAGTGGAPLAPPWCPVGGTGDRCPRRGTVPAKPSPHRLPRGHPRRTAPDPVRRRRGHRGSAPGEQLPPRDEYRPGGARGPRRRTSRPSRWVGVRDRRGHVLVSACTGASSGSSSPSPGPTRYSAAPTSGASQRSCSRRALPASICSASAYRYASDLLPDAPAPVRRRRVAVRHPPGASRYAQVPPRYVAPGWRSRSSPWWVGVQDRYAGVDAQGGGGCSPRSPASSSSNRGLPSASSSPRRCAWRSGGARALGSMAPVLPRGPV